MTLKNLSLCFCALFLSVCSDKTIMNVVPQTGRIHGRCLYNNLAPVIHYSVIAEGTDLIAQTDDNGYFTFLNVPPGVYRIYCSLDSVSAAAAVSAGLTTEIKDIIVRYHPLGDYNLSIYLLDAGDNLLSRFYYYSNRDTLVVVPPLDSFQFLLVFGENGWSAVLPDTVTLLRNNDTLCNFRPSKNQVHIRFGRLSFPDTFRVYCDREIVETIRIDTVPARLCDSCGRYFSLTAAPYQLKASGYGEHCITIDSVSYYIDYAVAQSCNFNLYLVNDSTGDTCSWKNKNPDWGVQGIGSDDPVYSLGSVYIYSGSPPEYWPDFIRCPQLQNGTYSIFVKYFDGPSDSLSATPGIAIELGPSISQVELDRFYVKSPSASLHKGDVWFAGKIKIPNLDYLPSDSIFSSLLFKKPLN